MKLELGCGLDPQDGYLHHDRVKHAPHVDVAWDLDVLPWPWRDEKFEEILAIDVMEHLRAEVYQWLGECWRILEPQGSLRMQVPSWRHENAWANPTHRRAFALRTFDFWDQREEYYQKYGCFDPELAADGRLWEIEERREEAGNFHFVLRKVMGPRT